MFQWKAGLRSTWRSKLRRALSTPPWDLRDFSFLSFSLWTTGEGEAVIGYWIG